VNRLTAVVRQSCRTFAGGDILPSEAISARRAQRSATFDAASRPRLIPGLWRSDDTRRVSHGCDRAERLSHDDDALLTRLITAASQLIQTG